MRVGRYINEVCALFDVNVIVDIDSNPAAICDGYKIEHRVTNHDAASKPLPITVALGIDPDLSAGIRSFVMTKWFSTEEKLDEFCELNINRFRNAAAESNHVPMDATEWR